MRGLEHKEWTSSYAMLALGAAHVRVTWTIWGPVYHDRSNAISKLDWTAEAGFAAAAVVSINSQNWSCRPSYEVAERTRRSFRTCSFWTQARTSCRNCLSAAPCYCLPLALAVLRWPEASHAGSEAMLRCFARMKQQLGAERAHRSWCSFSALTANVHVIFARRADFRFNQIAT